MLEAKRFLARDEITVLALELFVEINQPGTLLRKRHGMNVTVGSHRPPAGSIAMEGQLNEILNRMRFLHPYEIHQQYHYKPHQ